MKRASPVELRKAMAAATAYTKAGILFVAVPVLDEDDQIELVESVDMRLGELISKAEDGGLSHE